MENYVFWTFVLGLAALASVAIATFLRAYLSGGAPALALFRTKTDRRLGVVEWASVDSRRKLVLIRRDGVEHLLLTGGPVDVVVETGIDAAACHPDERTLQPPPAAPQVRQPPVFGRSSAPSGDRRDI